MPGGKASQRVHFVPVLTVALALRMCMVLSLAKGDPRQWFFNQASEYGCLAQSMLSGHGFASPFCGATGPSAFLAPGFPALVAAAFQLFGSYSAHAACGLIALQMIFASLTLIALMLLAQRLFGVTAANRSGALWAISPPALGLPALFWETSLSILLLTGAMLAALYCVDHPRRRNWAALGAFYAFAMLVNPSLLLTFAALLLWAAWQGGGRGYKGPSLALLVWCIAYAPWPIRNQYRLHAFVPLRTNLGYELWQGNRIGSDGTFARALHPNANNQEYVRYASLGELAYMREKSDLAIAAIKSDKPRFVTLSLERCMHFWLDGASFRTSPLLSLSIGFTSLMSVAGLVLLLRRNTTVACFLMIPFLVLPAPYYLTHADFRFRLLLDPLAMLLTAVVCQQCEHLVRKGSLGRRKAAESTPGNLPVSTHERPGIA